MLKKLLILLIIASPCLAQNVRKDDVAMQLVTQNTSAGTVSFLKPVPGAVITVGLVSLGVPNPCTITNTSTGSTVSCSALDPLCSSSTDVVCSQVNPFNADTFGNYGFWTKPSRVQVAITGIGVNGRLVTYDLGVGMLDAGPVSLPNGIQGASGLLSIPAGPGPLAQSNLSGPRFQQFTSSGTFTIPANVTVIKVTVVAGGGSGGGGDATHAGVGGGAGGAGIKWLSGLTPGNTITVTVGAGGTGVTTAVNGNFGVASSVSSGTQTITTISTNPGSGGFTSTGSSILGSGGGSVGSGGDINFGGGAGQATITGTVGGSGANSIFGGGGFGSVMGSAQNGVAPGAGGGGASGAASTSGNGANGIVIFEWVI